jgi:hypothetical protein
MGQLLKMAIQAGSSILGMAWILFPRPALCQDQWEWSLWLANEVTYLHPRSDSIFNPNQSFFPVNTFHNQLLAAGTLSWKYHDRLRLQASAHNRLYAGEQTVDRLNLKEAYAVVSLSGAWDLVAGKRIERWGTGFVFNPSGYIDPPKDPRDPADRLDLRTGRELLELDYTRGSHAVNLVYTARRLYFTSKVLGDQDALALRYNRLWKGLDFSVTAWLPREGPRKTGGNFSFVAGQGCEVHGELSVYRRRDASTLPASMPGPHRLVVQTVFGSSLTLRNGWTLTGEWYHDGEGRSGQENRAFFEAAALDSRLALGAGGQTALPENPALMRLLASAAQMHSRPLNQDVLFVMGSRFWKRSRLGVQVILLQNLGDASSTLIPQVSYQFERHWQTYLRASFYLGKEKSEYGSLPMDGSLNLGLRYSF